MAKKMGDIKDQKKYLWKFCRSKLKEYLGDVDEKLDLMDKKLDALDRKLNIIHALLEKREQGEIRKILEKSGKKSKKQ